MSAMSNFECVYVENLT